MLATRVRRNNEHPKFLKYKLIHMKEIFVICFGILFCMPLFAQQKNDWANFGKYENANKQTPQGSVVFMGNSITEGWAGTHPNFFTKNNFIGRGISGQVSSQMLARFRSDVINLKPKAVVILAGTNDIAQNNGYISLQNIMGNIISMCELAKANNIQPLLCSVLPASEFGWRKELTPAGDIIALNTMIKDYALKNKIIYVDYHTALKNSENGLSQNMAKDGVHPTPEAYTLMEDLVQKALQPVLKTTIKKNKKQRQYLFSKE